MYSRVCECGLRTKGISQRERSFASSSPNRGRMFTLIPVFKSIRLQLMF